MNNFSNSGYRVLTLIQKVSRSNPKEATSGVWAEAFGLDKSIATTDPYEVSQKLILLRHEVNLLEVMMNSSGFSENLYKPYINQIKETVSATNLGAPWEIYRPKLNAETILALCYCSEILESELVADFTELETLLQELENFKKKLKEIKIDGVICEFAINQIDIIEKAIRNYPIAGGTAIKKAFKDGFSDINDKAEDLEKKQATTETKEIAGFWKKLQKAGDKIVNSDRFANATISILTKGENIIDTATKYLSN